MTSSSADQDSYPYQKEMAWSKSEKALARTAFDTALDRELQEVIQKAKHMANKMQQSSDLWDFRRTVQRLSRVQVSATQLSVFGTRAAARQTEVDSFLC